MPNDAFSHKKMAETLAHGYSSESTLQELSNEYQHDMFQADFKNLYIIVLWTTVVIVLEGLITFNHSTGS